MDNGIALIAIVVAAVVGSTIVWLALRRNLPPTLLWRWPLTWPLFGRSYPAWLTKT